MTSPQTVVVGYDGSAPAASAIDAAGRLFPGANALITTVWRSVEPPSPAARLALPEGVIAGAVTSLDAGTAEAAAVLAEEGARRGREAGLRTTPLAAPRTARCVTVRKTPERDRGVPPT